MGLVKLTFDGSLNTAKQDAEFNYFLTNKQNGIIKGLGSEVSTSVMGGNIVLNDGYISVYGRRTYIETGTQVAITQNEIKKGYVILKINTNSNDVTLETKEGTSSSYPGLTQENLSVNDGIYEFPIVGYTKTTSSISLDETVKRFININSVELETVKNDINSKIDNLQHGLNIDTDQYPSTSGKNVKFSIKESALSSNGVVFFDIDGLNCCVCMNQIRSKSSYVFTYYDGSRKTVNISKESGGLFFGFPSTAPKMNRVIVIW